MRDDFLSHSEAALLNKNAVLHYVRDHGCVSRTDIWNNMNISRASVTQIIRQLQEANLIEETGEKMVSGRRMSRALRVNKSARFTFVFDWNTRLLCFVNLNGEILIRIPLEFPDKCLPSAFAAIVLDGVARIRRQYPVDARILLGIGLAMPGLVDSRACKVLYSVELGWRNVDIAYLFCDAFGKNVYLEREGNVVALGESAYGMGRGFHHVMLVLLENEGIGLSAVVHGVCQHGNNYMFGELGHIKLPGNVLCSCGQRGCLEAIVRYLMTNNGGVVDDEVMEYISFGVSIAVNLSDPGVVLLSGKLVKDLTEAQEKFLIERIRGKITNEDSRSLTMHICHEERLMGIRGMSAYVFNNCFSI